MLTLLREYIERRLRRRRLIRAATLSYADISMATPLFDAADSALMLLRLSPPLATPTIE